MKDFLVLRLAVFAFQHKFHKSHVLNNCFVTKNANKNQNTLLKHPITPRGTLLHRFLETTREACTTMTQSILFSEALLAHHALHAGEEKVTLPGGEVCYIIKSKNGCRSVTVKGINLMEQNRTKASPYAAMSRAGKRVTWVIAQPNWGLIIDNELEKPCSAIINDLNKNYNKLPNKPAANNNNNNQPATQQDDDDKPMFVQPQPNSVSPQNKKRPFSSTYQPKNIDKQENNVFVDNEKNYSNNNNNNNSLDATLKEINEKKQKLDSRVYSLNIQFNEYWCTPLNKTLKVTLYPVDEEYKKIVRMMQTTIADVHKQKFGYNHYKIVSLERIQNPDLWAAYWLRRNEISRINNSAPPKIEGVLTSKLEESSNEYYLFHGCNEKVAEIIQDSGFDERVSNLSGMFGCGLYFAENSSKSDTYTHTKECGQVGAYYKGQRNLCTCSNQENAERVMLVVRVPLGSPALMLEPTNKENPLRRPPDRGDGRPHDSVLGESTKWNPQASLHFREFIIYDRRQCYPEYIVRYQRTK